MFYCLRMNRNKKESGPKGRKHRKLCGEEAKKCSKMFLKYFKPPNECSGNNDMEIGNYGDIDVDQEKCMNFCENDE